MTAAPTLVQRDAFAAQAHGCAVRRVTRAVGGPSLIIGVGFWALFMLVAVVVPLIVDRTGNEMSNGILVGAEYSARWFAFSVAISMIATISTNHVAAGGTRRALFAGSVVAALAAGVLYGVLNVATLLGERALFGALGWTWHAPIDVVDPDASWFLHTGLAELIVIATYAVVGIAIAIAYQTHGPTRGTLLLVPSIVLMIGVDFAAGTGSGDDIFGGLRPETSFLGDLAWLAGAVAVLLVAVAWMKFHLSRLRLRPTK
jgi:hypothetical protein